MSENEIREKTRAYLVAYDEALKITHNPDFAVQVATGIIFAMEIGKPTKTNNQLDVLLRTIFNAREENKENGEET